MSAKNYVILKSIESGEMFFTINTPGIHLAKSNQGETWYEIKDYAVTAEDAQRKITRHLINGFMGIEICPE